MAKEATSSGSNPELEAMMEELGLREEDLQDVVVEEDEITDAATRWMAVARVHTEKPYSQYWFFRNMRVAWDLAQEVKIKPLKDNLYTMQFSCLGDWERVMVDGPWNFKGKAVVMAHYDGFTKPSSIELDKIEIWVQIHDFPEGYYPKIKALSSTVGEFVYAEPMSQDFEGNFARVRVKIDVTKQLKNAVSLVIKKKEGVQRVIFKVKYERLPDWCAVCGYLGHTYKECGDGVHLPKALVFKDLRATWFRGPGRGPGEGSGNGGGRGRGRSGRGRGRANAQRNSHDPRDREEDETKGNDIVMQEADNNRKRGADPLADPNNKQNAIVPSHGKGSTLMLPAPPEIPASPSSTQEPKRRNPLHQHRTRRTQLQAKILMRVWRAP